ncbi:MAG: RluA family pseudouridine synthase [Pseudomonadota bacterium]
MSGVQHRRVGTDEAEQRLDRWLKRHFPVLTQGAVERMCRKGELRVDGARAKASTRVAPGQEVRIPPLPAAPAGEGTASAAARAPDAGLVAELRDRVLYRDDALLVIDKPAGLSVQGGTGQTRHLDGALAGLRFGREDAPRLVHRLDLETSGVLVLGRTGAAATALTRAFRTRAVEKRYLAVVAGQPKPLAGTIRYALVKAGGRGVEKMATLHPDAIEATPGAQAARTDYRVLETAGGRASAVLARPVTGRKHQIRAHLAALGTPVAGDGRYGGRGQENAGDGWGASLGQGVSRKLHLHAAALALAHPATGRRLVLAAPLPEHMRRTWSMFGWDDPDPWAAFEPEG